MDIDLAGEALYTLLRSSQAWYRPAIKNALLENGLQVVKPRLIRTDAERLFGTDALPIVSHTDPIAGRFRNNSHTIDLWDAYSIHCSRKSTLMKLRRGPWGIDL